jgi:hypothetical protein
METLARPWFTFASRVLYKNSKGINKGWWLRHSSLGRESQSPKSKYLAVNEWICGHIGQFLRLPIPPFALMRRGRGQSSFFASLRFTRRDDEAPDDCNPVIVAEKQARIATGIVLFDAFVMNGDRHEGNIAVDSIQAPKLIHVFDHDRALLGNRGVDRIRSMTEKLGIAKHANSATTTKHCLIGHLRTAKHFHEWINRIYMIPEWFLAELCHQVVGLGITTEEADDMVSLLRYRKQNFASLIERNKSRFIKINDWPMQL